MFLCVLIEFFTFQTYKIIINKIFFFQTMTNNISVIAHSFQHKSNKILNFTQVFFSSFQVREQTLWFRLWCNGYVLCYFFSVVSRCSKEFVNIKIFFYMSIASSTAFLWLDLKVPLVSKVLIVKNEDFYLHL